MEMCRTKLGPISRFSTTTFTVCDRVGKTWWADRVNQHSERAEQYG